MDFCVLRKIFYFLFLVIFSCQIIHANNFAYIVVDGQNGQILYSHKADELRPPASLTKIMTCYLIFEALKQGRITLDTKFRVSKRATKQEPTNLWLKEGATISVKNIIMSLVTRSANDISVTIAEGLAGSVENFAKLMTQKALSLGMTRTKFYNPTGLPDKKQTTTARDMVILSQALFKNFPEEYKWFKTKTFYYNGKPIHNHNRMLKSFVGMDGIKTGFTFASRFNIAVSAVRQGINSKPIRVFAVVLGGQTSVSRDKKTAELMEKAFKKLNASRKIVAPSDPDVLQTMLDSTDNDSTSEVDEQKIEELIDEVETAENEMKVSKKFVAKHKVSNSNHDLPAGWVKGSPN